MQAPIGKMDMVVHVTRKETGEVETYNLSGHVYEEEIEQSVEEEKAK